MSVAGTSFIRNTASGGGAIAVTGGALDVANCIFGANHAVGKGGAILALNGTVVIRDGTLLADNVATDGGDAMFIGDARVEYRLPAPLGRWILSEAGCEANGTAAQSTPHAIIPPGATNEYPYPCAPGLFGESDDAAAQSGPQCSGLCKCG